MRGNQQTVIYPQLSVIEFKELSLRRLVKVLTDLSELLKKNDAMQKTIINDTILVETFSKECYNIELTCV